MHVITRKRLNEFAEKYPDTKSSLARWYANIKNGTFSNFAELRAVFPTRTKLVNSRCSILEETRFD